MSLDAKTTQLLEKVRKGATAGLTAAQFVKVLEACGFSVDAYRREDGSRGYHLATDSSSFDLHRRPGYRVVTLYQVLPWAKEQGLMEKVCELLGKPSVEEERAAKAAAKKTTERRFTCGCCFGEFKTIERPRSAWHGKLVRHGYQRPGYGYLEGGCLGEHTVPFEVSKETTERFLAVYVLPAFVKAQAHLEQLQRDPPKVFRRTEGWGATARVVEYPEGAPGYRSKLAEARRDAEYHVRRIEGDVNFLRQKIAAWVPTWRLKKPGELADQSDGVLAFERLTV